MSFREELAKQSAIVRERKGLPPLPLAPQIRTYKNAGAFQRDATRMATLGYTVAGQTQGGSRLSVTRMATLGLLSLAAPKRGKITVTWMPPA